MRTNKPVTLQEHLQAPAREMGERLKLWGRKEVVMGGGSILAARYGHRKSTDLDLWMQESMVIKMRGEEAEEADGTLRTRLAQTQAEKEKIQISWKESREFRWMNDPVINGIIEGDGKDVKYSLYPLRSSGFVEENPARGLVDGTEWKALTDDEILSGKLDRISRGTVVIRDLYDLCTLAYENPDSVEEALARFTKESLEKMVEVLNEADPDLHQRANPEGENHPILDGKRELVLEGLARRVAKGIRTGHTGDFPKALPQRKERETRRTRRTGRGGIGC